jgi:hypothetical protein
MPPPVVRSPRRALPWRLPLVLSVGLCAGASSGLVPLRADQFPFQGPAPEEFLRRGEVMEVRAINRGVTKPRRLTLLVDGIRRDAAWKTIDRSRSGVTRFARGASEVDFEDTFRGECAAYELDKMLRLGMVPATVERVISGERGALMLWIENAMSEAERRERRIKPPDAETWSRQVFNMRMFDNLIYNTDRNLNNLLVTEDWQIRLIDHSRAFRKNSSLRTPDELVRFSRSLLDAMARLDEPSLKERLGRYLSVWQIQAILERRDRLFKLAEQRAADRGDVVYYP